MEEHVEPTSTIIIWWIQFLLYLIKDVVDFFAICFCKSVYVAKVRTGVHISEYEKDHSYQNVQLMETIER